jgi:hypothetical protein
MLLVLSLAMNATPAHAQEAAPGSIAITGDLAQYRLATINNIAMRLTYPPQLNINGLLPSACYSSKLTTFVTQASGNKVSAPVGTISIFVRAVPRSGVLCSQMVKPFATTVSLDPRTLKLTPGKYLVLVNPVNGQSRFKTSFVVR